jgi:hypothetical protein
MNWEQFLRLEADRCGLKGVAKTFFLWMFPHEERVNFSIGDVASNYPNNDTEISCKNYLTEIFKTVGKEHFQNNRKYSGLKQIYLYECLKTKFTESKQADQNDARSLIPQSTEEKLHRAIAKLNYLEQEQEFQVALTSPKVAQALLVRVDDLDMQKWLTWRLMHVFKDVQGKPEAEKPPCYTTKANWSWAPDLEEFWQWLANKISCTYKSPKQMIQAVVEACKHSSLVIVVREISCLKPDVLASFVTDFWQPLTNQLNTDSRRFRQGRCLLFLTDEAKYKCSTSFPFLTEFAAWETVNRADLELWLERDPVTKMLGEAKQKPGEDLASICLETLEGQRPMTVIQRLAEVMGLANGIEDLVNYWDIGVV